MGLINKNRWKALQNYMYAKAQKILTKVYITTTTKFPSSTEAKIQDRKARVFISPWRENYGKIRDFSHHLKPYKS